MLDQLVSYLNNLRAGDVLLFIIVVVWAGCQVASKVTEIKDKHRKSVENDLQKREEYEKLVENLKTAQEELDALKQSTQTEFERMKTQITEHAQNTSEEDGITENALEALKDATDKNEQRIIALERAISAVKEQVDLLFKRDKESVHAYILEGYNRYVKKEHSISLITLREYEHMYNRYLSENENQNDEFLARIMRELRNLPTSSGD